MLNDSVFSAYLPRLFLSRTHVTLTQAELERINEVAPKNIAAGDRYADMSSVNR